MKSPAPAIQDLDERISLIERLLGSDPALADQRAIELLESAPGHPMVLLFRGIARRLMDDPATAIEVLTPLCRSVQEAPMPHLQLGLAQRETGDVKSAERSIRQAVAVKPDFSDAWLALADLFVAEGDGKAADEAFASYIRHSSRDPRLDAPANLIRDNRTKEAEALLRKQLEQQPNDVCAMCMLADVAQRHARLDDAAALLRRCLDLAPGYKLARHNYAVVLMRQEKPREALREIERLLSGDPRDSYVLNLKAAIHMRAADYEAAIALFEQVLRLHPQEPQVWSSLGHAFRTVGRREDCIEAYRSALALAPGFGEAAWNLANLKTYRISDAELGSMRAQLEKPDLPARDRIHFDFAVGKALEDREEYEESFRFYAEGNHLQRQNLVYDPDDVSRHLRRSRALYTPDFFHERAGQGAAASDPVFVVGLPRAGSTLVEQILASHSLVEGTMELPHITSIVKQLAGKADRLGTNYPDVLASLRGHELRDLGELYLALARNQRKEKKPFFIDKLPHNFAHAGLIHLILPNAKIIDVRRHPMANGMSLFRHLFASGHPFSYSLEDIGRYYRDYVEMMAHFDTVLPERVHRLIYESVVEDTETEVRRLLDYCGIPFETSCLRWFRNPRAVSTPSSEQVRLPVFRDGIDRWRKFEPWLGPLEKALDHSLHTWS